jgi:hypothetical protein
MPTTGSIAACVWDDLDGDGCRDAGERGLGGIPIDLQGSQGQSAGFCTTDASGCCTVTSLPPGTYTVTASAVQGLYFATPPSAQVEVFAGQLSEVSFGSRQLHGVVLPMIMKYLVPPVGAPLMVE